MMNNGKSAPIDDMIPTTTDLSQILHFRKIWKDAMEGFEEQVPDVPDVADDDQDTAEQKLRAYVLELQELIAVAEGVPATNIFDRCLGVQRWHIGKALLLLKPLQKGERGIIKHGEWKPFLDAAGLDEIMAWRCRAVADNFPRRQDAAALNWQWTSMIDALPSRNMPATDSNYKEQLLAMLTPVQRTNEVNGKLPHEFDGDELAQIVHTMTNIPMNKLPKKPSSTTPKEPKESREQDGDDDGDSDGEQARMGLAKERVDVVKRIVKRFVDAGKELVAETAKMKKEIKDGAYTGANYSSAKEGAAFKDAIAQIRGGVRLVHDGIGNLYDISEACSHDDIKEIDDARKAFYAFPMVSPPATRAGEES